MLVSGALEVLEASSYVTPELRRDPLGLKHALKLVHSGMCSDKNE